MHGQQWRHGAELPGDAALTISVRIDRRRAIPLGAGFVLATALALSGVAAAVAHDDGEVALEVTVERVPPGGTLPIVGRDWAAQAPLVIDLIVGTTSTRLGTVTTGPDGHFDSALRLPPDAPVGPASIDARASNGVIERAFFAIDPAAPDVGTVSTDSEGIDPVPFVAMGIAVVALLTLVARSRPDRPAEVRQRRR